VTEQLQIAASPPAQQRSVRTFLRWLVLGCLVPGIIGAALLLVHEYRQSRVQLQRDTLQTSLALVQAVDTQILSMQRLAQGLATMNNIVTNDLAGFHSQARRTLAETGLGSSIGLSERSGQMVVNTAANFGQPLPIHGNPELVQRIFDQRAPVTSRLFLSAITQQPIMAVGVPVFRDGKVLYALTVSMRPEQFEHVLGSHPLPAGWVITIFDNDATIVWRSSSAAQFVGQKPADDYLRQFTRADTGNFDAIMKDGVAASVAHARSPATGWRVAVNVPEATLQSNLVHSLSLLAVGIVVLFVIGFALAQAMSEKIARSFQALVPPATALGSGEPVSIPAVEVKEATEVTGALRKAAYLLRSRTEALAAREKDLAERSRALQQSEIRLKTLTQHAPAAIAVFDREMRYLAVSRRWLEDHQLEDSNVIGRSHYDVVPDLPPAWRAAHCRGLAGEVVRADQDRFERGDGSVQWFHWEIWPWFDENEVVGGIIIAAEEITERVTAELQLRASEARLALALRAGRTAVWELDVTTERLSLVEDRSFAPLGYSQRDLGTASDWLACIHDDDRPGMTEVMNSVIDGQRDSFSAEIRFRAGDGSWRWVLCHATADGRNDEGRAVHLVGTHTDINERRLAQDQARETALHDPLTGLPNRALVVEYCERLLAAAMRGHTSGALLFIDLDKFKPVNDLYGHEAGDCVLQEVAERLRNCTRKEDLVGRLGGDEFVVILPHLDDTPHRVTTVAQNIVSCIKQPIEFNGIDISISSSVGISRFPDDANDFDALLNTADLAMYQVKHASRDNFHFYDPALEQKAEEALLIEARLRGALQSGGLQLHYQPVIDVETGALVGAEALVRLAYPSGEPIAPSRFIPIAEAAGLVAELGEWVATEACRQHKAWAEEGLDLNIAINVSPKQLRQREFADTLGTIISTTGIEAKRLEIEVTESAIVENLDEAIEILNQIKSLGVRVALDDFGTGYSSLSTLTSLPLDKLKVDQSFVQRIEADPACRAVTDAIIALGKSLNLDIQGEGIESEGALQYLRQHGCDQAQGYWFSRPMAASEFAEWCQNACS
jgi:diguanylate cyclase (GGDEF)-like protein/PAS domain S-box-containing protein